jgi:hypothetical protein
LNGLATAAVCWPEFKEAKAWLDYVCQAFPKILTPQVYADGAQKEMTHSYHWVVLGNTEQVLDQIRRGKRPVPNNLSDLVGKMYNYFITVLRPSGHGLLNNDSKYLHRFDIAKKAGEKYGRKDWHYVATNGTQGEWPLDTHLVAHPWAGHFVFRNSFKKDALWLFFDAGPIGINHWHYDNLHVSLSGFGRDFLVDGGIRPYHASKWSAYFVSSNAHNVLLVDGFGANRYGDGYPAEAKEPISRDHFCSKGNLAFARGFTANFTRYYDNRKDFILKPDNKGLKETRHVRVVTYVKSKYFIIVDQVETSKPREIQALWHFHPECSVAVKGLSAQTVDRGRANMAIIPWCPKKWDVALVKGEIKSMIQGWYGPDLNKRRPCTTAIYKGKFRKRATFAWLLCTSPGKLQPVDFTAAYNKAKNRLTATITSTDTSTESGSTVVSIPIQNGHPSIKAP